MEFLYILLLSVGFVGLAFLMMNLRGMITGKEFRGGCANNNPMLKDQIGECSVCGRKPDEACKMPEVGKAGH